MLCHLFCENSHGDEFQEGSSRVNSTGYESCPGHPEGLTFTFTTMVMDNRLSSRTFGTPMKSGKLVSIKHLDHSDSHLSNSIVLALQPKALSQNGTE